MPRSLLPQIEKFRASRISAVSRGDKGILKISQAPRTSAAGLYWIYTNYPLEELQSCTRARMQKGSVDMARLAALHAGLRNVCEVRTDDGFWLVYNGVAGPNIGIRKRLHQHFNGGEGTGCLGIRYSSLNDVSRWRISFATLDLDDNLTPDVRCAYHDHAKSLERMWRLEHGWPLLCTH
jgi:hypothetical protein